MMISGQVSAQHISIIEENTSIQRILEKMKKEYGLDFIGDMNFVRSAKAVSVNISNRPIREVLTELSRGQDFVLILSHNIIYLQARPKAVLPRDEEIEPILRSYYMLEGTVYDEGGKPIQGVTIKLLNSDNWASVSSKDGSYAVEVFDNSEVLFTMQGYEPQRVRVDNRRFIAVRIVEKRIEIEETIVTGYTRRSKESFTGASSTITRKELEKFNNRNIFSIIESLDPAFKIHESNVDGSDPNKIAEITLRGQNMVTSEDPNARDRGRFAVNSPLVIMDGFESSMERLYDMDPNRLESITILKDAAATALYGSRGGNGVLVVETRLPKQGKLTISYNQQPSVSVVDLTDFNLMNAKEKIKYERLAGLYSSESIENQEFLENIYRTRYLAAESGVNTDWVHQAVQSSVSLSHSLRIEGGNEQIRYSLDGNYSDTKGGMIQSGRKRAGAGFNLIYRLANKITFRNNASFTNNLAYNSPYGRLSEYANMNPYYRIYDDEGKLNRVYNIEFGKNNARTLVYNPLYNAQLPHLNESLGSDISNNLNIEYFISPEFRIMASGVINKSFSNSKTYLSPNNTQFFTILNLAEKGFYTYSFGDGLSIFGNLSLNYGKSIGKHVLNLLGNAEIKASESVSTGYSVSGFMDDDFISPRLATQYSANSVPIYINPINRLVGVMLNGSYSYDNRLVLEGTYRIDGSSAFGHKNRYSGFWSTGAAYNMHQESFMQNSAFNMLRIFGNYGISGLDSFSPNMTSTAYDMGGDYMYFNQVGFEYDSEGNPYLKWPQIYSLSAGLETSIFQDLINLRLNVYKKRTENMVSIVTVAPSVGLKGDSYYENMGEVTNKGIEAYVNIQAIRNPQSGFSWYINASGTRNVNKLTKISEALRRMNELNNGDPTSEIAPQTPYYEEGESLNNIKGLESLGIDPATGKELFLSLDGTPTFEWTKNEMRVLADATPLLNGTLGTTINYRGLSIQGIFYYVLGQHVYNSTLADKVENVQIKYNVDKRVLSDRWIQPGDHKFFKGIANTDITPLTSRLMQKENTLRLSTLNINYDLNPAWISKWKLQRVRINASMNDLFRVSTIRMERGTSYPFTRSYNFGINIQY